VVDNGSEDGSPDLVRRDYAWVYLIKNEENLGFAKAVNSVLRESKRGYAFLLNPDTRIKQGMIATMVSFMESHLDTGVAGAQLLNPDGSKQNSIANFPSLVTELFNKSILRWLSPRKFPGKERFYPEPIEVDSVIGAAMIVRREAMERVGLLDEDYFLFLEETDWCYRMKRDGWKVYHIPQAEVYHFQGKSAEAEKKRAKVEYFRSRYLFFKKNRGSLQWVVLITGLWVRLCAELIIMAAINLFTLGRVKRWKKRLSVYAYLLWWHVRFCPEGMGLRPMKEKKNDGERRDGILG
jgi:GT2 family glycosyltransferase